VKDFANMILEFDMEKWTDSDGIWRREDIGCEYCWRRIGE
jgi:hypothetical protein